jgi:hypothetical protein
MKSAEEMRQSIDYVSQQEEWKNRAAKSPETQTGKTVIINLEA